MKDMIMIVLVVICIIGMFFFSQICLNSLKEGLTTFEDSLMANIDNQMEKYQEWMQENTSNSKKFGAFGQVIEDTSSNQKKKVSTKSSMLKSNNKKIKSKENKEDFLSNIQNILGLK